VCFGGEYCSNSTCECRPSLSRCLERGSDGTSGCRDTNAQPNFCGGCTDFGDFDPDFRCAADQVCAEGVCVDCAGPDCEDSCGEGLTACDRSGDGNSDPDHCADLMNDPLDCGACTLVCGANQLCVEGECTNFGTASACDACPCDDCGEGTECCVYPGTVDYVVCVEGGTCPGA
jgi:hypothetical protein